MSKPFLLLNLWSTYFKVLNYVVDCFFLGLLSRILNHLSWVLSKILVLVHILVCICAFQWCHISTTTCTTGRTASTTSSSTPFPTCPESRWAWGHGTKISKADQAFCVVFELSSPAPQVLAYIGKASTSHTREWRLVAVVAVLVKEGCGTNSTTLKQCLFFTIFIHEKYLTSVNATRWWAYSCNCTRIVLNALCLAFYLTSSIELICFQDRESEITQVFILFFC